MSAKICIGQQALQKDSSFQKLTAATIANGPEPKSPEKKRQRRIVWRFSAVATPIVKTENPKIAMMIGNLRP